MILLHHLLAETAARRPDKTALICGDAAHTFARIDRDSDRIACRLQQQGISRGDRVAIFMENSAELVVSMFGICKAGGVFVILNPTTKPRKLAYVLNDCGVRFLMAQRRLGRIVLAATAEAPSLETIFWTGDAVPEGASGQTFEQILAQPHQAPQDPGLIDQDLSTIIYTSGSTGDPRGVMLTHRNITNTAWSISTYLGNIADDVVLCVLPLSFDYGLYQVLTGARVGFSVVLEPSFAYPYRTVQRMAEHRVTGLPGVPTIFARLLQMAPFEGLDLSAMRYLTNTAAALPPAHIRRLGEVFPTATIFSMYGLTECTRVSYLDPARLADKITSVGKAIPNSEVYIVDAEGRRVGPGVTGELVVRGANVMRGYWGKDEQTRRRLQDGDIDGEKVLRTGDLFQMDSEGFLYFVGRTDDVFKCKGEKISPKEIENVLYELDAVVEAAVIGVDDPIDGKAVKAIVAVGDGSRLTEQAIRRHCRESLENYMVPKFIEIRPALPKTESGKIRKSSLA